jgi:hypothetical protein
MSISRHAKMTWALLEPIWNVLHSNLYTDFKKTPKAYRLRKLLYARQPTPDPNASVLPNYIQAYNLIMPSTDQD